MSRPSIACYRIASLVAAVLISAIALGQRKCAKR